MYYATVVKLVERKSVLVCYSVVRRTCSARERKIAQHIIDLNFAIIIIGGWIHHPHAHLHPNTHKLTLDTNITLSHDSHTFTQFS